MRGLGLQRGVAVLLRRGSARASRPNRAEGRPRAVATGAVVSTARAPSSSLQRAWRAVEEPHVPVGIALAVREPAAEEAVAAGHRVDGAARARRSSATIAARSCVAHPLVGVEAQHPVVRGLRDRELLLLARSRATRGRAPARRAPARSRRCRRCCPSRRPGPRRRTRRSRGRRRAATRRARDDQHREAGAVAKRVLL